MNVGPKSPFPCRCPSGGVITLSIIRQNRVTRGAFEE